MPPRIAIPMPHSADLEYSQRAIPQYERAVVIAGGEPVRIPLNVSAAEVRSLAERCDGVLLPGSNADIDPTRFRQKKSTHAATADLRREEIDNSLLEHAYERRKPVLGICYGLQSLNVFRGGSLIQHIPDFLPEDTRARVNHEAGRDVPVAHTVSIEAGSELAQITVSRNGEIPNTRKQEGRGSSRLDLIPEISQALGPPRGPLILPVNSSHHQSAEQIGEGLRIVARCPDDSVIEALESSTPDHFVLAVQWHPERSVDNDEHSKRIFHALIDATRQL